MTAQLALPPAPARMTRFAGALSIAVGTTVLAGWTLDIAALKSLLPAWVSVKPNTAIAFVLLGLGLLLARAEPPALRWAARFGGLLAGLIGLITLSEYLLGWSPGVDQWLFREPAGAVATSHPGRMAPDTALCFVLLAAALEVSRAARRNRRAMLAAVVLGALAAALGMLALLAALLPGIGPHGWWGLTAMAAPTAVVFVALGTALLLDAWQEGATIAGSRLTPFSIHLWRMVACVGALAVAFVLDIRAGMEIDRANALRHRSFLLADELRQSGDDLTRMARTYVVTGDPVYRDHFQEILDIRDGRKARPEHYWRPYWDLVSKTGPPPRPREQAVPLLEMMKQAGFTDEEFSKLAEAKANSDGLTLPEIEAMKLVESTGPEAEVARARARRMMHDEKYHQAKAAVMGPIHDFLVLVDQRTQAAVRAAERGAAIDHLIFAGFGLALIFALWRTYVALGATLGGSVDELHGQIARIGSGDSSAAIRVEPGLENSVLGWLSQMQAKLAEVGRERERAAAIQSRLAAIVESSADAIISKTLTGVVMSWNRAAEQLFGYAAAEMIGQPIARLIPSDRRVEEDGLLARIGRGEGVHHFNTVRMHKEGHPIDVSLAMSAIRGADGQVVGASTIARDVGELMRAEAALRSREQELRLIMDTAPALISYIDADYRYRRVNRSYERWFGRSAETVHGRHVREVLGDAAWETVRPHMEQALAGETVAYQRLIPYRDGGPRWVHVTYTPDRDDSGRVRGFVVHVMDISDLRRAETALRESEQRFRATFEQAAIGFALVSPEGRFELVNETLCAIVGYSREELTALTFQDITHPEDLSIDLNLVRKVLAGEIATYTLEKRYIRKDRSLVWINLTVSLVRDAAGEPAYFIAGIEDISRRKQAEADLLRLNATLEQRVAERTAQLETANKELEAFSYSVSHDLRAPLRAIDGYGRILAEDHHDRLDEEGRRVLGVITSETRRMGQLIDDLLAFSRLGRQKLESVAIDMTALARSVYDEQMALSPGRSVRLDLSPLTPARGDRSMIRVVLGNLISNAIKFTRRAEHPTIEIGSREEAGDVIYHVKDNGVGFDMRYANKLFGVFQRLHSADDFEGTGVGLALCQRVVHRHHGRIWADAKVNQGATFCFALPGTGGPS